MSGTTAVDPVENLQQAIRDKIAAIIEATIRNHTGTEHSSLHSNSSKLEPLKAELLEIVAPQKDGAVMIPAFKSSFVSKVTGGRWGDGIRGQVMDAAGKYVENARYRRETTAFFANDLLEAVAREIGQGEISLTKPKIIKASRAFSL